MKHDFLQVLTQRGRHGKDWNYKVRGPKRCGSDAVLPKRAGMRGRSFESKHSQPYWAPVLRYLRKQVGRPWDEVYSELCHHLRGNRRIHVELRQWIAWFVECHPMFIEGVVYNHQGSRPLRKTGRYRDLYVDAQGRLRKA